MAHLYQTKDTQTEKSLLPGNGNKDPWQFYMITIKDDRGGRPQRKCGYGLLKVQEHCGRAGRKNGKSLKMEEGLGESGT